MGNEALLLLQNKMLEMLLEIDQLCRENDIRYYLHAGTALGAIRHGGFIPWDDDTDIVMTRENWEKFKIVMQDPPVPNRMLEYSEITRDFPYTAAQYKSTDTTYFTPSTPFLNCAKGCVVDIFIMDPAPADPKVQKRQQTYIKIYGELLAPRYIVNNQSKRSHYQVALFCCRLFGRQRVLDFLRHRISAYSAEECDGYIQRIGMNPSFWDKRYFGEAQYFDFNGHKLPLASDTLAYFRYAFGDSWMILPPPAQRHTHPHFANVEIPYSICEKEVATYVNAKRHNTAWKEYKKERFKALKHETVARIANAKRIALSVQTSIEAKCRQQGIEPATLLKACHYSELEEWIQPYYDWQKTWLFTHHRIAIHLSEEWLYAAWMAIVLRGEYYLVDKFIAIYEAEVPKETQACKRIKELVEASRALSIACYDERDWARADELVEEWLARYPHHVDFVAAKLMRMCMQEEDPTQIKQLAEEELAFHPQAYAIMLFLADAEVRLENHEAAGLLYDAIVKNSMNGLLVRHVQAREDYIRWLAQQEAEEDAAETATMQEETEEDASEVPMQEETEETTEAAIEKAKQPQDDHSESEMITEEESVREEALCEPEDEVQKIIFRLLVELDTIFKKESIPYFLYGYTAAQAVKLGAMAPRCYVGTILAHPADRKRMIAAIKKHMPEHRCLDCFETNKNYVDFTMRYSDMESLWFNQRDESFYRSHGIYVSILFIRPFVANPFIRKGGTGLMAAVEAIALPSVFYNNTRKKIIAGLCGRMASIIGKKNLKRIIWHIVFKPKQCARLVKRGLLKSYWSKTVNCNNLDFSKSAPVMLNGHAFSVPVNYQGYVKWFAARLSPGKPVGGQPGGLNIVQPFTDGTLFQSGLHKLKQKRKYARAYCAISRINNKLAPHKKYMDYTWNVIRRTMTRYALWQGYMPHKEEILALHAVQDYDGLRELLKDYILQMRSDIRYGIGIVFDLEIFNAALGVLIHDKEYALIQNVLTRVPKAYYRPIPITMRKGGDIMQPITKEEWNEVMEYISRDVAKCIYIYMDLTTYGLDNPNIHAWMCRDKQEISMIVMQYYESLQAYSDRDTIDKCSVDGLLELIAKIKPNMISATTNVIKALEENVAKEYVSEYGVVYDLAQIDLEKLIVDTEGDSSESYVIEHATEEDIPDIAAFIINELGENYIFEDLKDQLLDRMKTNMGRSYIIRDKGKLIAHAGTFAETDRFAVTSGLGVSKQYRNTLCFAKINSYLIQQMLAEGKRIFSFRTNRRLINMDMRRGILPCSEYGKLIRRDLYCKSPSNDLMKSKRYIETTTENLAVL